MVFSKGIKIKTPAYTKDTELYNIESIPKVFIPVSDSYTLTVAEGDRVLVGQLLGIALGRQTPLHCSVSGTVAGCIDIDSQQYLEIENDGKYELCSDIAPCEKRLSQMTPEEMIDRIRLCGIDAWQLLESSRGTAKRLVISCVDTDPYSCDRKCTVANFTKEVVGGAKIILKSLGLRLCEILIERKNTDEINLLIDCIGDSELFDIIDIRGKYPLAEDININKYLSDADGMEDGSICMLDVHSVAAVYKAFSEGMPYVRRTVSIGGSAAREDGCFDIPIGTPIKYIVNSCVDRDLTPNFSTVTGGVMKGKLAGGGAIVVGDTHSIAFFSQSDMTARIGSCIGCSKCDNACPEHLFPSVLVCECENDFNRAMDESGMDMCTQCGACTYACPASIPICEIADGQCSLLSPENRYKKRKKEKAPFISNNDSVRAINTDVIIALGALLAWAVCVSGVKALLICAVSVLTAVLTELLFNALTKSGIFGILDLNSVACGMLTALTLGAGIPLYACVITSFFAVMFLRGAFGGSGKNLIHSAFGARILASALFHDAFEFSGGRYTLFDFLIGNNKGALGEVSVILLCAVFLYLVFRRIISPITPLAVISAFTVVTFFTSPAGNAPNTTLIILLGTGILYVAVFCGVEYSTVPKNSLGKMIYGITVGIIAALIGRFTSYEGAYIAALASSLLTPALNRMHRITASPAVFDTDDGDEQYVADNEAAKEYLTATGMIVTADDDSQFIKSNKTDSTSDFENQALQDPTSEDSTDNTAPSTSEDYQHDYSQTMEFSDTKADELLSILSAELGLADLSVENKEEAEDNAPSSEQEKEKAPELDSTELFNILYNEEENKK